MRPTLPLPHTPGTPLRSGLQRLAGLGGGLWNSAIDEHMPSQRSMPNNHPGGRFTSTFLPYHMKTTSKNVVLLGLK